MSKLAISNLAWKTNQDGEVLEYLHDNGIRGLEIAPTKIFGANPFSSTNIFSRYSDIISNKYKMSICSFQSIWYGLTQSLSDPGNHPFLLQYTRDIVKCASAIGCKNIVFGNPRLRKGCKIEDPYIVDFFTEIGEYANKNNTCISLEPNPDVYDTDFLNNTKDVIKFCKTINCDGLKINMDLGTIIYNNESISDVLRNIDLINHIHISEPFLKKIIHRTIHKELNDISFDKYISIEMNELSFEDIKETIGYVYSVIDFY